jgi:resuscitation-promoting factor RpfB
LSPASPAYSGKPVPSGNAVSSGSIALSQSAGSTESTTPASSIKGNSRKIVLGIAGLALGTLVGGLPSAGAAASRTAAASTMPLTAAPANGPTEPAGPVRAAGTSSRLAHLAPAPGRLGQAANQGQTAGGATSAGRHLAPRITLARYVAAARRAATSSAATSSAATSHAQAGHSRAPRRARTPRQIARSMLSHFHWGPHQFRYLNRLWSHESGWNPYAANPYSGAYGIPQAMPGYQMSSAGRGWRWNARTQIRWGMRYIRGRYGSPRRAWWHETGYGWY